MDSSSPETEKLADFTPGNLKIRVSSVAVTVWSMFWIGPKIQRPGITSACLFKEMDTVTDLDLAVRRQAEICIVKKS